MPDALTLILETSTPRASLAIVSSDGVVEQRVFTSDRSHNASLFAPLQELLDSRRPLMPGLVLVGSGPGSYSGTRVGIAAAQGVAIACGCPAVAVPSILAVHSAAAGSRCLAVGDARRGSFWTASIDRRFSTEEPQITDAAGLEEIVTAARAEGTMIFAFEKPEKLPLPAELLSDVATELPGAARLWRAWLASDAATKERWMSEPPQPIYLKPPHITAARRPWLAHNANCQK